jgi:hypothetical protein
MKFEPEGPGRRISRKGVFRFFLFMASLFFLAWAAVTLGRTPMALAVFSRREVCALCACQSSQHSIVCLNRNFFRFGNIYDSQVTKILAAHRERPCEHAFYEVERATFIFSVPRVPHVIREKSNGDFGADVYNSKGFARALSEISRTNGVMAKRIWTEAFRNSFLSNGPALKEAREALANRDTIEMVQFLSTNRHYRVRLPASVQAFE